MFYHLVHDDKFIDLGYQLFEEAFPKENIFILPDGIKSFRYIKTAPVKLLEKDETVRFLTETLTPKDFLVIHYLSNIKIDIINAITKRCPIIWMGWGGDYYPLIFNNTVSLLLPITKQLYFSDKSKIYFYWKQIKTFIKPFSKKIIHVSKKIDILNTVIPQDYQLIKKNHPKFIPRYFSWNYANLSNNKPLELDRKIEKKNILIGNSSDPTNNHADIFQWLTKISIEDRKIICPLSYGEPDYAKKIIQLGNSLLGKNFYPLTDYIPLIEYYKIIESCETVFMNHLRQQATGNVITLLIMGCRIILQEKNPLYHFFNDNGFYVNTFQEIEKNCSLIFIPLSDSEKEKNKSLCENIWSNENAKARTLNLKKILS